MSDGLGDIVNRLLTRRLQTEEWGSAGTILAYDPARHTAKARLHPAERDTGWLPLLTLPGVVLAPAPGAPCYVHLQRGVPAMIAGVAYSDRPAYPHSPPAPGLALDQHSISVQSLSVGDTLTLTPRATLPTPTARGQVALLGPAYSSASGDVPDTLWVTLQDGGGLLSWSLVPTRTDTVSDTAHGSGGTVAAGAARAGLVTVATAAANGTTWTISTTAAATGRAIQLTAVCGVVWNAQFNVASVPNGSSFGVLLSTTNAAAASAAGFFYWTVI